MPALTLCRMREEIVNMDKVKPVSSEEEQEEIAFAADLAAQKRLKTILDLAIAIGQREGLIRTYSENTATETLKASAHDPSACNPSAHDPSTCNEASVPTGNVPDEVKVFIKSRTNETDN